MFCRSGALRFRRRMPRAATRAMLNAAAGPSADSSMAGGSSTDKDTEDSVDPFSRKSIDAIQREDREYFTRLANREHTEQLVQESNAVSDSLSLQGDAAARTSATWGSTSNSGIKNRYGIHGAETRPSPEFLAHGPTFQYDEANFMTGKKDRLWRIKRTINGNLPVYEKFTRGGVYAITVLRHVEGNQDSLRKELMRVCEAPVRVRTGAIEIRGLHTWKVKEWLTSLGM